MSIRSRLSKLELAVGELNKPLFEMSDADLERFLRKHLKLPADAPLMDEILLQVVLGGSVKASRYTHEEAPAMLAPAA